MDYYYDDVFNYEIELNCPALCYLGLPCQIYIKGVSFIAHGILISLLKRLRCIALTIVVHKGIALYVPIIWSYVPF